MRKILYTAAAAAAITAVGLAGSQAMASSSYQAVTHSANHADTTSVTGTATVPSPGGPVWAYDNLTEQFSVTPAGAGMWNVTINVNGSFQGFADPRMASEGSTDPGGPLTSAGSVKGTISYLVSSPNTPNRTLLPAQEADGTGLSAALAQLFGGNEQIVGGGSYNFSYNQVGGGTYTQVG
jgi:hypothetical protein